MARWRWEAARALAVLGFLTVCLSATVAQKPAPDTTWVETSDFGRLPGRIVWDKDGAVMVLVPAGKYKLGVNKPQERGFGAYEGPAIEVELGSYYIDVNEVSVDQYGVFAKTTGANQARTVGPGDLLAPGHPVVAVSHFDALQYAKYVRKDLPTEAEWEAAARGAEGLLYPWGAAPKAGAAALARGGLGVTDPVGTNPQDMSPFGVMDVAGNVSEWTKDDYSRTYYADHAGQKNPFEENDLDNKVVRGGNFYLKGDGHLTQREPGIPQHTRDEIGFRTVYRLVPPPTATPTPTPLAPTPSPTPTEAERISAVKEELLPYFQDTSKPLPEHFNPPVMPAAQVPVSNFTPHAIVFGFLDLNEGILYGFPQRLDPGGTAAMELPKGIEVQILAFAPQGPLGRIVNLGPLNSDSEAFVIVPPHAFNKITVTEDGKILLPDPDAPAIQIYRALYQPMWHEFEVYNATDYPMEVFANQLDPYGKLLETITHPLPSREAIRFTRFGGTKIRITARYAGATADRTSRIWEFKSDKYADHRVIVLEEDTDSDERARVLTKRLPLIRMKTVATDVPYSYRVRYMLNYRNDPETTTKKQ
ncbi:SUMF1/EgtB/PvdO family nonheme iron enzyme [Candidatus Poribacteria bacterium]|nr:SUMF1/EgtB/PvdO family nonheme iron enzyme [Candidatus Poribacteria bacterium]